MKQSFSKKLFFFIPSAIFLLLVGFVILSTSKADTHLYINHHHTDFLDGIFKYVTHLGSGWIIIPLGIVLLFIKYNYTLMLLLSYGLSSALAQGLKHLVFGNSLRPKRYFEETGAGELDFVNGIDVHSFNSMPSGHTTTAFCIFCLLTLISPNKWLGLLFGLLAILAGFSRVYINQHFLEDIFVGALLGMISALVIYFTLRKKGKTGFLSNSLLRNRP